MSREIGLEGSCAVAGAWTGLVRVVGRDWDLDFTLDDQVDLPLLEHELRRYLSGSRAWYEGGAVTVNVGRRLAAPDQILRLRLLLEDEFGLRVSRFWCRTEALEGALAEAIGSNVQVSGSPEKRDTSVPCSRSPLIVKHTCRSGSLTRHDGDVLIMGDVNPGAEVEATGDIVVLGTLRGVAHAAAGSPDPDRAVIVALSLQPLQLRIGPHVRARSDAGGKGKGRVGPEIAFLSGRSIVVAPYEGKLLSAAERTVK